MTMAVLLPENRGTFFPHPTSPSIVTVRTAPPSTVAPKPPTTPTAPVYALPQPKIPTTTPIAGTPAALAQQQQILNSTPSFSVAPAQSVQQAAPSTAAAVPPAFSSTSPVAPGTQVNYNAPTPTFQAANMPGTLSFGAVTESDGTTGFPWWILLLVAGFWLIARASE